MKLLDAVEAHSCMDYHESICYIYTVCIRIPFCAITFVLHYAVCCSSLLCLTVYTRLRPQQCSGFTSKKHAFCATIERVGLVHSIDRFDSEGN